MHYFKQILTLFLLLQFTLIGTANNISDYLLPHPRNISTTGQIFSFRGGRIISKGISGNADYLRVAKWLQSDFANAGMKMSLAAVEAKGKRQLYFYR